MGEAETPHLRAGINRRSQARAAPGRGRAELDADAALLTDGDSTLHRSGVEFGQQRLVGLDLVFARLGLRKSATASEVAQDAPVEARGDQGDVLVGERFGTLEAG